jgi:hypothetical protein
MLGDLIVMQHFGCFEGFGPLWVSVFEGELRLFVFFFLLSVSACILPVYLGAPYAFNKTSSYLPKKKKKKNTEC